ncbi:MAG: DUF547 domain-containing protein [Acidimicrobiia bacterium]|nr:DUF547 domain-containing protein [Acidimicrobiia bacterium]
MSSAPNPIAAAWSMLRARRLPHPAPRGEAHVDHDEFRPVLDRLTGSGISGLLGQDDTLTAYRVRLETVDPDSLTRSGALAYWLNLYNAGALHLATRALSADASTVLRVPGGFTLPWTTVAGRKLSLDDIEHGLIRRFGDPRIHAALVCGSASCPTLRHEPFTAEGLDSQLDDQMRSFLAAGGAVRSSDGIALSRVFKWYGGDLVRPHRMPTLIPARSQQVLAAIVGWLEPDLAAWIERDRPSVSFQTYDWSLGCSIG